jgi:hypothetical protein
VAGLNGLMTSLANPRAGKASLDAAMYESHYLTATDPTGGRALWLRYTALKRAGGPPHATIWVTYFDRSALTPRALRVSAPEPLRDPGDGWLSSSLGQFRPWGARGAIAATGAAGSVRRASWQLSCQPRAPELRYLPAHWLYDRAVPRSNGAALMPAGTAMGVVTFDGQDIGVDGWETIIGHNWGSEHPEQWCWIHVAGLGEDRRGWLDLVLARIRIGPFMTPWLAAGALHLGDRRYAPAPLRRVICDRAGEHTHVSVSLWPAASIELAITAPGRATVRWDYASPRGPGRVVDNCSVADATLRLRSATSPCSVTLEGSVAIEHGAPQQEPWHTDRRPTALS